MVSQSAVCYKASESISIQPARDWLDQLLLLLSTQCANCPKKIELLCDFTGTRPRRKKKSQIMTLKVLMI